MIKKARNKLGNLISYKPRWGLTLQGWLLVLLSMGLGFILLLFNIQPFLAYSMPVKADVLIVEGWIGDDGIEGAMNEFRRNRDAYQLLITTGIPLGRGEYLSEYKNFAQLSKATLIALGFDRTKIQSIPTPSVKRDRTYTSALAVKEWLDKNDIEVKGINIYSEDVHSRRSWILFKKVFEPTIKVGAIAHPAQKYDANSWWTSSQGVRTILSEGIAYIYAKFL